MAQIVVDIDRDGQVQVQAQGVQGTGCQQLTRALEEALGTTTGDVKKPEFYQQQQASQGLNAGLGK